MLVGIEGSINNASLVSIASSISFSMLERCYYLGDLGFAISIRILILYASI